MSAEGQHQCAFCGEAIEPVGFDPCEVTVKAARSIPMSPGECDPGMWWFHVHAACVPRAMYEEFRDRFAADYSPPQG